MSAAASGAQSARGFDRFQYTSQFTWPEANVFSVSMGSESHPFSQIMETRRSAL